MEGFALPTGGLGLALPLVVGLPSVVVVYGPERFASPWGTSSAQAQPEGLDAALASLPVFQPSNLPDCYRFCKSKLNGILG
jgi:hypothetical protein